MDKAWLALTVVVALSFLGVVGDFFIKLAGNGPRFVELKWFALGFAIYALTAFGWFYVMKNIKLATLGVFYGISTILFLTAAGVFYFKEQLNALEMVGILLALVSLALLGRFA